MSLNKIEKFTRPPIHGVTRHEAMVKRLSAYREGLIEALKVQLGRRKLERNQAKVRRMVGEVREIAKKIGPRRG